MPTQVIRAACPHDCPDICALLVTVEDSRTTRVQGDPDHPTTAGVLCTKANRYAERTYHPNRLLTPMKCVGAKGEDKFELISWDEAIDTIATRLGNIAARNPEAILSYSYVGTMGLVQGESITARFSHRLGMSLLDRTICASAGATMLRYAYGASLGMDIGHVQDTKLILIWGANSIASNLHFWTYAQEAKRRGAIFVVIDLHRLLTAEKRHRHSAVRSGTDAALTLAMIHVSIRDDLLDHDYIANHTLGFEALHEYAWQYTPKYAATPCEVDAADIEWLVKLYGMTVVRDKQPTAIRLNYSMQHAYGGGQGVCAVACPPSLVGAWRDAAGGLQLSMSGFFPIGTAKLRRPDLLPIWPRMPCTINMSTIGDALLHVGDASFGPKVEAAVIYNSNSVAAAPDSRKVTAGFAHEDLFTVVLEHFQTDTADYADILLPAITQLEHIDVHKAYGHTYVLANNVAIVSMGQSLPNTEIFRRIARRMGLDDVCFTDSDDDITSQAARRDDPAAAHIDWATLKREGWQRLAHLVASLVRGGYRTLSGRCEFYFEQMANDGLGPPPGYVPLYESAINTPELAKRYSLSMILPSARNFLDSTFVDVDSLCSTEGELHLDIHPDNASAHGVVDGEPVRIFNDRGTMQARIRVTGRVRRGVVVGPSIWWKKLAPDGTNANELTSQRLTDMGCVPTSYDCLTEVASLAQVA